LNHLPIPETQAAERLEAGILEAARLRARLDETEVEADRAVLRKQLEQTELRVEALRRRLRG